MLSQNHLSPPGPVHQPALRTGTRPVQTLFFCVGAAKSGTSWLYNYLSGHPQVYLRRIKEVHYFDRRPGELDQQALLLRDALIRRASHRDFAGAPKRALAHAALMRDMIDWFELVNRPDSTEADYLAYLSGPDHARGDRTCCGDITPHYALLPADSFRRMAGLAETTRFLFLMRDPVQRLWSHCRMRARLISQRRREPVTPERVARAYLTATEDSRPGRPRFTDYAGTLERLRRAVGGDAVHVEFYEDLTTQDAVDRITACLGLEPWAANPDQRINPGVGAGMDADLRDRLRARLEPQYRYVAANAPRPVPRQWLM